MSVPLGEFGTEIKASVKPQPQTEYEMYSVPAFFSGRPEVLRGMEIKSSKRDVAAGDLLLCKINPRINRVWWVAAPDEERPQLASSEYLVLRLHEEHQDLLRYLVWYLRSPDFRRWIELNVEGATGSHTRAKSPAILQQRVPLAPPEERREIAEEIERQFTRLNVASELLIRSHQKLNAYRAAVLERTIVPGENGEAWPILHLGDVLDRIEGGKSFRCEQRPAAPDEWGVLKVSAVTWGTFKESEQKALPRGVDPLPDFEVQPGDLLISRANTVEYVGRTALVSATRRRLLLSDKTLRLHCKTDLLPQFLHYAMATRFIRRQIEEVATGTSDSMRNISQAKIRALKVPVPPLDVQESIVLALARSFSIVDEAIRDLQIQLIREQRLRQEVLSAAFSGILLSRGEAA